MIAKFIFVNYFDHSMLVVLNLNHHWQHHLCLLHVLVAPLEQVLHVGLLVGVDHHDGRHPLGGLRVAETHRAVLRYQSRVLKNPLKERGRFGLERCLENLSGDLTQREKGKCRASCILGQDAKKVGYLYMRAFYFGKLYIRAGNGKIQKRRSPVCRGRQATSSQCCEGWLWCLGWTVIELIIYFIHFLI